MFADWISWFPQLVSGLGMSLAVTALSLVFGLPFGLLLALGMLSRLKPLSWLTIAVVEVGRGVPLLVVLYLLYFGFPGVGIVWTSFVTAVVGISFTTGAYTSEIFRAGILNVPRGHREAAQALGLTGRDVARFVVLPQAVRSVIAPIVSFGIIIFQASSLGYAISLPELTNRAYQLGSVTFQFLSVFALAGLMYAVISILVSRLVDGIERRTAVNA